MGPNLGLNFVVMRVRVVMWTFPCCPVYSPKNPTSVPNKTVPPPKKPCPRPKKNVPPPAQKTARPPHGCMAQIFFTCMLDFMQCFIYENMAEPKARDMYLSAYWHSPRTYWGFKKGGRPQCNAEYSIFVDSAFLFTM